MFKLTQGAAILRVSDGAWIPAEPQNRDYAEYLDWVAKGNVPEAADPPPLIVAPKPFINDIEDLKTRLASLEGKVQVLETKVPA